jgi:hypothetical protein
MRILLDESLSWELKMELPGHEVRTVQEMGWSSMKNGELLARGAGQFDVFITADQNLRYQQNLSATACCCRCGCEEQPDIRSPPLIPNLLDALAHLRGRTLVQIGA